MSADLDPHDEPIELPEWVKEMVARRTQELRDDPSLGLSHEEVWRSLRARYGDFDNPESHS